MARVTYFRSKIALYTTDENGFTATHMKQIGRVAKQIAKGTCPEDSGDLKRALRYRVHRQAKGFKLEVGVLRNEQEQERRGETYDRPSSATLLFMITQGHPGRIYSKLAREANEVFGDGAAYGLLGQSKEGFLWFIEKGGTKLQRRRSVRGYAANHFLAEACEAAWPYPVVRTV